MEWLFGAGVCGKSGRKVELEERGGASQCGGCGAAVEAIASGKIASRQQPHCGAHCFPQGDPSYYCHRFGTAARLGAAAHAAAQDWL